MSSTLPIVVIGVDTHAHVFRADLPLAPGRRYSPDYDASVDSFLGHLNLHGVSHGVLVQPSFLGTDNSFMVAALRQHPSRLRGIAVVDPEIHRERMSRRVHWNLVITGGMANAALA
ncbi:amidohydrolase family protein [Halomonas binhaiensis]|uniref:Amidohydrolase-related domain-containing protein n=1 Tax=Halomonas binhaiensis TaxID=2562282 RepID=A0A7U3K5T5_9GAMM|nr:amidohydrolase family protein [Halomonas binhaiensis]QRG26799.1 hypothetical protein E4T21_04010 [Halomonas binhaiensis]